MRLLTLTIMLIISPSAAFAYFDPGTGALLMQAAIGAVAAITVFWGSVKAYARSVFSKDEDAPSHSGPNSEDPADETLDVD